MLFLDPLALALFVGLVVYVVAVWRGRFRSWFGRDEGWTALAWPFPLLVLVVPALAGLVATGLGLLGLPLSDRGIGGALTYVGLHALPVVLGTLWPPRWLLPGWARARLVTPPTGATDPVPALLTRRGHGSLARWVWWVDAIPGTVCVEGSVLRFRSSVPAAGSADAADRARAFVDEALGEPELTASGEVVVVAPRGGRWTHDDVALDLDAIDQWRRRARRPRRRDGVLVVEVAGRRPLHLWLADVDPIARAL